jgi:glutamine synthetase
MYSILMDDGLLTPQQIHNYKYHDQFTGAPTKRILRIETLAESLMAELTREARVEDLAVADFMADTYLLFTERFEIQIKQAIADPEVVGFKSVVCYRSYESLDIEPDYERVLLKIGPSFEAYIARCVEQKRYRVDSKYVNDFLVLKLLELLTAQYAKGTFSKPVQFHTGLGDNDINLLRSNPAYLQPLIERYPEVPFVILHSAYPYTREAGYLAMAYKNVFLDVGEVFPMLSRDGELKVLRQALELAPFSKLLWSTDGHFFPETYWLANRQFREVLEEVLVEYAREKDILENEAIGLATAIMFNNANYLYNLQYPPQDGGVHHDVTLLPYAKVTDPQQSSSTLLPQDTPKSQYDMQLWTSFLKQTPDTRFIFVQWLDWMGLIRHRVYPSLAFQDFITSGQRLAISLGNAGTLQNDFVTSVANTTGTIHVEPDLRSLRPAASAPAPSATVMACFCNENGEAIPQCARCLVKQLEKDIASKHSIDLLVGFEIEITFLRRISLPSEPQTFAPITSTHAWSTLSADQWNNLLPLAMEIADALASIGIHVQAMHPESAPGQYEFILPPLPAVEAIDTLVQARQCIAMVAEQHAIRATLHPVPFPGAAGSGAHAHISLNPSRASEDATSDEQLEKKGRQFWAEVLAHLEGICAFSLPEAESYGRVAANHWTGGVWIAWGTQNREVPVRKSASHRWEVRVIDGFANMYLVLGAIMAAGLKGMDEEVEESITDCSGASSFFYL